MSKQTTKITTGWFELNGWTIFAIRNEAGRVERWNVSEPNDSINSPCDTFSTKADCVAFIINQ